jgi:hypothetical protein
MSVEVKGNLINMQLRAIGDSTWKTMVCTSDSQFQITNSSTAKKTNCGTKTSVSVAEFTASGNAVHNAVPGANEVSYNDVKGWQINKTKLQFQWISAADADADLAEGDGVNNYGEGYFTSSQANASADDTNGIMTFSWTFTGDGTLDTFSTGS